MAPRSLRPPRLIYVVTHPMAARLLLRGQLDYMRRCGFDVAVVASPGADLDVVAKREDVEVIALPMPRAIRPYQDVRALLALYRLFRSRRPDIVSAGTTKAGLLGTLAARLAGVPVCIYTLRGLRMETARGLQRILLGLTEHAAAKAAHRVLAVSPSLARAFVEQGFARPSKVAVVGRGSSNGVDLARFAASSEQRASAEALRSRLGLPAQAPVVGFVGRFTRDKGIPELVAAFERVWQHRPEARLLLVGDFEEEDPVPAAAKARIEQHPAIVQAGFVADVAPYYGVMDVLAFPSHREGLPNVPLEAAAAGIPTVGALTTGTVDAVEDGVTGRLVTCGDPDVLAETLLRYLEDEPLRRRHGEAARKRVAAHFRSERVWEGYRDEFVRLLRARGLPLPQASPAETLVEMER